MNASSAILPSRVPDLLPASAPGTAPALPVPSGPAESGTPPAWPNPSLRLDPALGIVVMEFRDRAGGVQATLPTERELAAYRATAGRRPDAGADAMGPAE
jgi:hypothetical protein